jgi:hypothetical protein
VTVDQLVVVIFAIDGLLLLVPSILAAGHTGGSCPRVDAEIVHDADLELVTGSGTGSMPRDHRLLPASA